MSFAQKNIEHQQSEAVPSVSQPPLTQILIIAQGDRLTAQLAQQMASDDAVQGQTQAGTLAQVVKAGGQGWSMLDFVVFEVSANPAADLAALHALSGHGLQFVAVSQTPLSPQTNDALLNAGVAQVLVLPAPKTDDPVLAVAPQVVADVGPSPIADAALPTLPEPELDAEPEADAQTGGSVTVMLRARGGAGATTIAVNLALGLAARTGAGRTALVDLDLQNGSVGLCLDMPESADMTAFVKGHVPADAAFLDKAVQTHASGLDVLTAPDVFAPLTAVSADAVAGLIDMLKTRYDHIVLDMPQAVIDWLEPALDRAARVLVVTDMSVPSIRRTRRLIDLITEDHMTLPIETVVNFEKRPRFPTQAHKEATRLIGRPLTHWVPADVRAARRATDMGVPLQIGAKRSASAKAVASLSQTLFDAKRGG